MPRGVHAAALLTLAAVIGVVGCGGSDKAAPTTTSGPPSPFATAGSAASSGSSGGTSSTASTGSGPLALPTLHPGLCFDADTFQVGSPINPRGMHAALCSGPHQHEVFAVFTHPDDRNAPWPGDDVLDAWADDHCLAAFDAYVGIEYERSTLDIASVHADEAGWRDGDRTVACAVHDVDFALLTGTVQGTAK